MNSYKIWLKIIIILIITILIFISVCLYKFLFIDQQELEKTQIFPIPSLDIEKYQKLRGNGNEGN